ncbi:MAG: hydrogenase maturation nickel metallochaperone HypA [Spirochaetia bacterium]|nr:hydrogenase maturation nickel metallochaperone HypA [Spirochaetia bacterium]
MHELGLMAEIVDKIEAVAKENNVTEIGTLVLNIGEYSGVVPEYVEECYPAVIEGTLLEKTELKINIIPGKALCWNCGKTFAIKGNEDRCPHCQSQNCKVIEGGEFIIKEIVAR